MGSKNSSKQTMDRAALLSDEIGSNHLCCSIDSSVEATTNTIQDTLDLKLNFKTNGGSNMQNLCLQNVQARTRMVMSYMMAMSIPISINSSKSLLVLGTSNVDERFLIS